MSSIQRQTAVGIGYKSIASAITIVVGFTRSVILANILAPSDFGAITFALFFTNLIGSLTQFSFRHAFIHSDAADAEESMSGTLLTIDGLLAVGRIFIALALWPLFAWLYPEYPLLPYLITIFFATMVLGALSGTPMAILERRLAHKKIALINITVSITITLISVGMAWWGWGIWSLVAEFILMRLALFIMLFAVLKQKMPRLGIDRALVRRFSKFSLSVSATNLLAFLLDRFDDFWIGNTLGQDSLGFYSRAYEFARYPRRILSEPIVNVTFPAFARLQDNPLELAQLFTRSMGLLIRSGFVVALVLFLVAPEFISLLIGEKWLPVVNTFRLMAIYTLFDPLYEVQNMFFVAIGRPTVSTRNRAIQVIIFIPAVILFSSWWAIDGVALAANLMIFSGFSLMLWRVRREISFSVFQLFAVPLLATAISYLITWQISLHWLPPNLWWQLLGKAAVACFSYAAISLALEFRLYQRYLLFLQSLWRSRSSPSAPTPP